MISTLHIGNAPCSWGSLEFAELEGQAAGYARVLDELRETGYLGSELGDWGFMPTDPAELRAVLDQRGLTLTGAFVPVALRNPAAHAPGAELAVRTARLLAAAEPASPPFLVLADDNCTDPTRTLHAGRITPAMGLSADEWRTFAAGTEQVARAVHDATGLRTVFHHHCAGYVETPAEIDRLLDLTDPDLLGLVFDTGHYLYGAGRDDLAATGEALARYGDRIWYMHFKDCEPRVAAQARAEGWDYFAAVGHGVFCELGRGCADFPAAIAWLRARGYQGWVTVEQDVLPGMGTPKASAQRNRAYLASLGL